MTCSRHPRSIVRRSIFRHRQMWHFQGTWFRQWSGAFRSKYYHWWNSSHPLSSRRRWHQRHLPCRFRCKRAAKGGLTEPSSDPWEACTKVSGLARLGSPRPHLAQAGQLVEADPNFVATVLNPQLKKSKGATLRRHGLFCWFEQYGSFANRVNRAAAEPQDRAL